MVKFSFLGLGHESPPLQLYGKLPIAKDYLRIGCAEGSGRELREWLDRTFGTARAGEELELDESWNFLGQGSQSPLQGCLWPSADAGEHRKFPFTVFVERRAKALLADLERGSLAQAESVWHELAETRERCLAASDGARLLEQNRGREIELDAIDEVPGAAAEFDAWVNALWPDERLDGLFELLARVEELARERYAGPYRLPLVRDLPQRDQVVGWTAILRALGALPEDEIPTLFFPPRQLVASSAPSCLVISRAPLADDAVVWLTTASGDGSLGPADFSQRHDAELDSESSPPEAQTPLRESLREALASFRTRGS